MGVRDWAWFLGTTRFYECDAAPFAMWRSLADRAISRRQGRSFTGTGKSYMEMCGTPPLGCRVSGSSGTHPASRYWTLAHTMPWMPSDATLHIFLTTPSCRASETPFFFAVEKKAFRRMRSIRPDPGGLLEQQ